MFSLNNKTHFSLLQAYVKPSDLAKKCKEYGYTSCGMIDYGNVSCVVDFCTEMKKVGIKPILGCEFEVVIEAGKDKGMPVIIIARNLAGWRQLIGLVTKSNSDELFIGKPHLDLASLLEVDAESLICISNNFVSPLSEKFASHFYLPSNSDCGLDLPKVALTNVHYINKEDSEYYRILLALRDNVRLKDIPEVEGIKYLPTLDKLKEMFNEEELANLDKVNSLCESYNVFSEPKLPTFQTPSGQTEDDYLRELCRQGWKSKIAKKVPAEKHNEYRDRVLEELKVIKLANLAGYFLIVQDFIRNSRENNVLVGPGRGSAAGSLVSYLIGITLIDPIPYGLLFSRFFNASRSYPKHLSFDEYKFVDDWRTVGS